MKASAGVVVVVATRYNIYRIIETIITGGWTQLPASPWWTCPPGRQGFFCLFYCLVGDEENGRGVPCLAARLAKS
jgi:hypothetical protein